MNWSIVGLGAALLYVFPKITGKVGKGKWFISGPVGFIVIVLGIVT